MSSAGTSAATKLAQITPKAFSGSCYAADICQGASLADDPIANGIHGLETGASKVGDAPGYCGASFLLSTLNFQSLASRAHRIP